MSDARVLTLRIITPTGASEPVTCDSVHFPIPDDVNGRGGGSFGVRPGHERAVAALAPGLIAAFLGGEPCFSAETDGGFVSIRPDSVTVASESFSEIGPDKA